MRAYQVDKTSIHPLTAIPCHSRLVHFSISVCSFPLSGLPRTTHQPPPKTQNSRLRTQAASFWLLNRRRWGFHLTPPAIPTQPFLTPKPTPCLLPTPVTFPRRTLDQFPSLPPLLGTSVNLLVQPNSRTWILKMCVATCSNMTFFT